MRFSIEEIVFQDHQTVSYQDAVNAASLKTIESFSLTTGQKLTQEQCVEMVKSAKTALEAILKPGKKSSTMTKKTTHHVTKEHQKMGKSDNDSNDSENKSNNWWIYVLIGGVLLVIALFIALWLLRCLCCCRR